MDRPKIAVLFGGRSSEYDISLQSAFSVIGHIDAQRYEPVLIGITKEGDWFRYYGDRADILNDRWRQSGRCVPAAFAQNYHAKALLEFPEHGGVQCTRIDAVFPVLHGKNGEDGTVQGLFELAGVPVIGCGTLASALCMDKDRAHRLAALAGVDTPAAAVFSARVTPGELMRETAALACPLFVKPVRAGSSFGITKVDDRGELWEAVRAAFEHDDRVIVEQGVPGFEVGCAVIGNEDQLTVGAVDEIELSDGFFDFDEKYTLKSSKIHMPARIDDETAARICSAAETVYRALGCSGFARVDMFLTPEGRVVFNEVNTIPGFTAHSRFPNMMRGVGMTFAELIDTLIRTGLRR